MSDTDVRDEATAGDGAGEAVGILVEGLSSSSRRRRQESAHRLAELSREDPELLAPYVDELEDALFRPEAQTRWEALDMLTALVPEHAGEVEGAFEGAETSLFDEDSSTVRLAAFLFLATLASVEPGQFPRVWPLLDEAVQCYHGDPEYREMLEGMLMLVRSGVSDDDAQKVHDRVAFDAKNGVGFIKSLSEQIVKAVGERHEG